MSFQRQITGPMMSWGLKEAGLIQPHLQICLRLQKEIFSLLNQVWRNKFTDRFVYAPIQSLHAGFSVSKSNNTAVKLIDFTANYSNPNVGLKWTTSQEHNFNYFMIERSTDGANFNQVALVFGAGESDTKISYSYNDKDLKGRGGIIYYRLKQVDIDGKFSYSNVRIIRLGDEKKSVTLTTSLTLLQQTYGSPYLLHGKTDTYTLTCTT
jgi:hypothetical protein